MENILKVKDIFAGYDKKIVLKNINFEIEKGEFCGIIGPNGSGKTTLLKILAKILKPFSGEIYINDCEISKIHFKKFSKIVSYLPSSIDIHFSYTVEEIILFGKYPDIGKIKKIKKDENFEIICEIFQIKDLLSRKIWELSDGEKQRVFLSQTFIQNTEIVLLDEPISHLDIGYQFKIMDIIKKINRESKKTIISIFHDLNIASEYCDKLLLVLNGEIYSKGTPDKVLTFENIEKVYNTNVIVYKNPYTSKPFILSLPSDYFTKM